MSRSLRCQLEWLTRLTWRDAGGVLVVLRGGTVWMGTATAPAAQAVSHGNLPSTVVIIVYVGA